MLRFTSACDTTRRLRYNPLKCSRLSFSWSCFFSAESLDALGLAAPPNENAAASPLLPSTACVPGLGAGTRCLFAAAPSEAATDFCEACAREVRVADAVAAAEPGFSGEHGMT